MPSEQPRNGEDDSNEIEAIVATVADEYDDRVHLALDLLRGGLTATDAADAAGITVERFTDSLHRNPEDIRGADTDTGEVFLDFGAENRAMFPLALQLREGDRVEATVELPRQPGDIALTLTLDVTDVELIDDHGDPPRIEVFFEQIGDDKPWGEDGDQWRGRFGYPGSRAEYDNGEALLYEKGVLVEHTGIFHRLKRVDD